MYKIFSSRENIQNLGKSLAAFNNDLCFVFFFKKSFLLSPPIKTYALGFIA